ncbi:MAG TPA: SRPBCC domain-containing protein [Longimicrobiales bacterium]|nr:SRPBCC domain-containing protein [Longimicrobiales bacterium]
MSDDGRTPPRATGEGTRSASGEVEIDAPVERVWRALTEARELERWFPLEARVSPGKDGSIWMSWKNEYAGESRILEWDPPHRLVTSWGWHEEDAAPAQRTEYVLEERGGRTVVRVTTSGFPTDASWDGWVEGTVRGWRFELASLKRYLERHEGTDRTVVYLRRRVALPPEEAWRRLLSADGFGEVAGSLERFDDAPPLQVAGIAREPAGAVVRLSSEPTPGSSDRRDMTLWIQLWGEAAPLAGIERAWRARLERVFPEGQMV